MSSQRRERLEEVFTEASLVPVHERNEFVRRCCGDDEALCEEVLSLLGHHDEESSFLDHAELVGLATSHRPEVEDAVLPAGTRIAGFTIDRVIGSGGMGVVYVAEQERPRRTVALKVMTRTLRATGALRRFELEAEVLGRLQHPGIAQVYEAGAADVSGQPGGSRAQPYIAMELISGPPLDEFARRQKLGLRQRLEIIARVCDAVQHAHQRGIIHRDLKPGNILVDPAGQPKVLDFGVARDTAQSNTTMHTGAGQLIGTLAYMSPEQVLAGPEGIDTRSDVYALGVILYQLLTGRFPYQLDQKPLPEAARIIRDEEPARPGTQDRQLRGEVETIVLKALSKDRQRRYQSAADLGQDIQRFLDGRPIAAREDSALYVLGKQIRRYRGTFAAAALVLCLLIAFAIYAQVQSTRNKLSALSEGKAKTEALESLKAAKDARDLADRTSQRLQVELIGNTVERGRLLGSTGDLSAAEGLLWPAFFRNPDSHQTRWALWELYSREPCLATMQAHRGDVNGLVLSPDEQVLYTIGDDGVVQVWDRASARVVSHFEPTLGSASDLAISPDGRFLAAGAPDGRIIVWNAKSGEELWRSAGHNGLVRDLAFSPDSSRLATAGNDSLIKLWTSDTGSPMGALSGATKSGVWRIVWSPDGAWIVFGNGPGDGRVMAWDGVSPQTITLGVHPGGVQSLAVSPRGGVLASGGADRAIQIWDLSSHQSQGTLLAPNGYVTTLHFTSDGKTLMSTGWWTLDLWDVATHQRRRSFSMRAFALRSAITADGRFAAAGLASGRVQFWDVASDAGCIRLAGHDGRVAGALSPDGRIAATGDMKGVLRLWDAIDGSLLAQVQAADSRLKSIRFSPDGLYMATGAENGTCKLWDLRTGDVTGTLDALASHTDDSIGFTRDSRFLAVVRLKDGWTIELHRVPDLALDRSLPPFRTELVGIRFAPDGKRIAAVARTRAIHLVALDGGEVQHFTPPERATPWSVCFAPDSSTMVVGDWDRELEVWDLKTSTLGSRLRGHRGLPASVEFLPSDPDVVVSSAADGVVRFWDVKTGSVLASLSPFEGWDALSLSISSDGRRLLTTSARGDAVVCDLSYFDRHIALNAENQLRRITTDPQRVEGLQTDRVRAWAASVLIPAESDSAFGPIAPETIKNWATLR